jgi:NAD(P)-dependent dehydrogenase (short-subunit alcohol dehydrogenase family)
MQRNALITGTSTGIGEACVARLADAGWRVFAGVRREEDGDKLLTAGHGDVRPVLLDVADDDQIESAVAEVRRDVGAAGLHGLVSNAGIGIGGPVELVSSEDWRRQFEVNLFGAIALTRAVFELVRAGSGRFVYVGSQAGRFSLAGMAPYSATKHALEALCESMRQELINTPVEVSLVEPGNVKTAIWEKTTDAAARVEELLPDHLRGDYGFVAAALRGIAREGAARGIEPKKVADTVEHALVARRPRPRYLVGPDAKLIGGVVTRLPDRLRERALGLALRRFVRRGGTEVERNGSTARSTDVAARSGGAR